MLGAAEVVGVVADLADLEDEEVLGRERVVELVRVDLEQDRGRSTFQSDAPARGLKCQRTSLAARVRWFEKTIPKRKKYSRSIRLQREAWLFLDLICSLWLLYSADRILCSICIIFWGYTDLKNGSNSYQTAKKTQLTKT